jgi:hypothetical protein
MKLTLSLLLCLFCASCCDECADFDFVRLRLKTADNKDFLSEHRLSASDVTLFTIHNGDTLQADAWPEESNATDSTVLSFYVTHEFTKAYISVNREVKDSLKLNMKITDSYCCHNQPTIQSVEFDKTIEEYERFEIIEVVVE